MTRPTSSLQWWANITDPLSIRALWIGALWHYTLDWGDHTDPTDMVFWNQRPVSHTYTKPGKYLLTARPKLINALPVSVEVVVRPEKSPQATVEDLGDGKVQLWLRGWAAPVLHRVDWGDGSQPQEFGASELAPEHAYELGIGRPTITVVDVPARRTEHFIGPDIPKPPVQQGPAANWNPRGSMTAGTLEGIGFTPGVQYEVRFSYSTSHDIHPVTADAQGKISLDFTYGYTAKYSPWRCIHIRQGDDLEPLVTVPVLIGNIDPPSPLGLWFTFDLDHPWDITLGVQGARAGDYAVSWGDGSSESVACDGRVFVARHRYSHTRSGPFVIAVTDPRGYQEQRVVAAPEIAPPQWGVSGIDGVSPNGMLWVWCSNTRSPDNFLPLRPHWGLLRSWQLIGYQFHLHSANDSISTGYDYYGEHGGKKATVLIYRPLARPAEFEVTVPVPTTRMRNEVPSFLQRRESVDSPPVPNRLTHTFHPDELKPSYYTAFFQLANESDSPSGWSLEFTLAAPAVLTEIYCWRGEVTKTDLGNGRWRITGSTPVPGKDSTRLDITVDPCGSPRIWPTQVALSPPQPRSIDED